MTIFARAARRFASVFVVAVAAVAALLSLTGVAAASTPEQSAEARFAERINAERAAAGLNTLAVDASLAGVARGWSAGMGGRDSLAHNPDYAAQITLPWQRVGENVGVTTLAGFAPDSLVDTLHAAFMASPGHRDNVMGEFNAVGVGVVVTADKLWVTVNFALVPGLTPTPTPAPAPAPAPAAPAGAGAGVGAAVAGAAGGVDSAAVAAAIAVSAREFTADTADCVVLARSDVFADALAGSALAGADCPILYTTGPTPAAADPDLHPDTAAEIARVLPAGGTVYLLGGPAAIGAAAAADLSTAGYAVTRLAGADRIATSLAIAEAVLARRGATGEVLLARADTWADAISGGAYAAASGSPLLLTDSTNLDPAVAAFLTRHAAPARRVALGGTAALSDAVVNAAQARRIAGDDRTATAVAIAQQLWGRTTPTAGDTFVATPAYTPNGWATALAHTSLNARHAAPGLLIGDTVSPAVTTYLTRLHYTPTTPATLHTSPDLTPTATTTLHQLLTP
jgi:uncharacterized protein YkwD/putative cell wall-binding protein